MTKNSLQTRRKKSKGRTPADKAKGKRRIEPIRNDGQTPRRNALCPCDSGLKYKKCHGKPIQAPVYVNPYQTMASQYTPEQKEAEQNFIKQWGFNANPSQLMAFMEGDNDELKKSILRGMSNLGAEPKFAYAVNKLDMLVTPKNQKMYTPEEIEVWEAAIAECPECPQPDS